MTAEADAETSLSAALVRKTSAKPGAGTGTEQVFADVSHDSVVTFSVPESRPSASKLFPSVCALGETHCSKNKKKKSKQKKRTYLARPGEIGL